MSNQIVISSGAKVRNLSGVLTGTAGVVDALGINVPSGIPQLDGSGKILVSQLPNSVMEYKGTWNAATNTPTLVNGTGNQGDVYLVSVAGTVNFGAGPITFAVGDQAIYSGTIWQKAGGSTGTVTSVAVTESGDALTITGSPITTSGTINIGFAGNSGQYVNGAGGLTTFPSLTGFVPYTGATANVDLGTYSLLANSINALGSGTLGGTIALKQNGQVIATTGYAYIGSESAGKLNIYFGDTGLQAAILDNSLLTADRTYTLPDLSGTLALLEGTQTFSGEKTFGTDITFNGYALMDIGVALAKTSGTPLYGSTNGYANLQLVNSGSINSLYLNDGDTNKYTKLSFNNAADYTYTFPAASGTIALTSNLSSYVPYTGATANLNLGTFDLTADVITGATGSFASSGGSDTFAINHSSGSGIALNITKGGNGEGLYINKTSGSGNALTVIGSTSLGALIGTTATFTNSGTGIGVGITNSGNGDGIKITHSLGRAFNIQSSGSGFGIIINNETASTSIPFTIQKQGGSVVSITDAGELTLANSATALSFVKSGGTSSQFLKADGSVDSSTYLTTSSAASTYVPYTGATANVNLGIYGLLAQAIVVGQTSTQGYIHFKTGGSTALSADTSQAPYGTNGMIYSFDQTGGNYKQFVIDSSLLTNNTIRTYSMPDANGTVALTSDINSAVSGTTGRVPLFTSTNVIGNSQIYDNGTTIGVGSSVTSANKLVSVLTTDSSNAYAIMAWGTGTNTGGFYSNVKSGNIFYAQGEVGGVSAERFKVTNAGNLSASGSGTFGGALSGTSATFSDLIRSTKAEIFNGFSDYVQLSDNTNGLRISNYFDVGGVRWDFRRGTTSVISISQGNNVGIGTTSPLYKLQVVNSSNTLIQLNGNNTTGALDTGFTISADDSKNIYLYQRENAATVFGTNNAERMRITSGGNVGIGTSSPAYKFVVSKGGAEGIEFDTGSIIAGKNYIINYNRSTSAYTDFEIAANNTLFSTAGSERMRITSGGDVAIGTSTPLLTASGRGNLTINGSSNSVLTFGIAGAYSGYIYSSGTILELDAQGSRNMGFNTNGQIRMTITSGGDVLISNLAGTGSRAVLADANGYLSAPVSDISVKENITTIGYGLNEILKMNPVWFDFIDEYKNYGEGRQNGNIAQEMQEIIPEAVFVTPSTSKMGINYDQMHAVYIKAIQELEARIKQLENK